MRTLDEVQHALSHFSQAERDIIRNWLQDQWPSSLMQVAEPAVAWRWGAEPPAPAALGDGVDMTFGQFMALFPEADDCYEFVAGRCIRKCKPTFWHARLVGNLHGALWNHLRKSPCEPVANTLLLTIKVDAEDVAYCPDVMVVCDHRDDEENLHSLNDARLIIEVLSPSTQGVDKYEKRYNYQHVPSLEEYVMLTQWEMRVTIFRRAEGWRPVVLRHPEQVLELSSVDLRLTLAEIYKGVSRERQ